MAFLAPFIPAIIAGVATIASSYVASKATGKSPKNKQLSTQTKSQQEMAKIIEQAIKNKEGPLAGLFKDFDVKDFEKGISEPALKHFTERILPQLQEKFVASGQAGSPGAAREIGRAGQDLEGQLAGLLFNAQQQHKLGADKNLLSLLGIHQNPASENIHTPGHSGLGPAVFKAGADITGKLAANAWDRYNNPTPATTSIPTQTATTAQVG